MNNNFIYIYVFFFFAGLPYFRTGGLIKSMGVVLVVLVLGFCRPGFLAGRLRSSSGLPLLLLSLKPPPGAPKPPPGPPKPTKTKQKTKRKLNKNTV